MNYHSASQHLRSLVKTVEEIAAEAGVLDRADSSLDATLKALPDPYRSRVRFTLEIMRAFSDDVALHAAANLIDRKAVAVWSNGDAASITGATHRPSTIDLRQTALA
jgi:hypothetical protein